MCSARPPTYDNQCYSCVQMITASALLVILLETGYFTLLVKAARITSDPSIGHLASEALDLPQNPMLCDSCFDRGLG